jgi:hypothetical protein
VCAVPHDWTSHRSTLQRDHRAVRLHGSPPQATQLEQLYDALFGLPLAAGLASVLALRPRIEDLLHKSRLEFSMRTISNEEVVYEVQVPLDRKTDRLSNAILQLDRGNAAGVEWKKKEKK